MSSLQWDTNGYRPVDFSVSQGLEAESWLWDWSEFRTPKIEHDKAFDVAVIECWKYDDDEGTRKIVPMSRYEVRGFHSEAINSWVKEPAPICDGQQPSSGFKIIVMPCFGGVAPLTDEQEQSLNAAFGFPNFQNHYGSAFLGAYGMFLQSDNSYVFITRRTSDFASISTALRYDPQKNVALGIFYVALENTQLHYFKKMPSQFIQCSHPLLLPLLAIELTFETKISHLIDSEIGLLGIENTTGYGVNASQSEATLLSDYRELVRKLGDAQNELYLSLATITACRLSTQFIRQKIQYLDQVLPEECQKKLNLSYRMLYERIDFLLSNMEHACVYNSLKERMQSQQTVLFNLIAQSDSLTNVSLAKDSREIAVASKQDSSAMKIIALLTTFFLPGTFVATFFAMPLFNWSEPSLNHVTNRHFWIYWAVTAPLTLAIMAGVAAWALWHNHHVQLLQSRARESVGKETTGDAVQATGKIPGPEEEAKNGEVLTFERPIDNKHTLFNVLGRRRRARDEPISMG